MNRGMLSFTDVEVNYDLLYEVWKFDPRALEYIDGPKLSSYAMALSQYLIYFSYQRNLAKAEQYRLNKRIDRSISLIMASDETFLKKHKTKAAAWDFVISTDTDLMDCQTKLDALCTELIQTEGMDKVISELIATIKRELTRRESELYQIRAERKN